MSLTSLLCSIGSQSHSKLELVMAKAVQHKTFKNRKTIYMLLSCDCLGMVFLFA